jgi:hypothetical protein
MTHATVKKRLKMRAVTMACHPRKARAETAEASWSASRRRVLLVASASKF